MNHLLDGSFRLMKDQQEKTKQMVAHFALHEVGFSAHHHWRPLQNAIILE